MSANTSIKEGGKPRPFGPVKALMVQGEDGKYYPWFPESDRALGTLSVDKNGIYRASDKGVYGWVQVYVNVAQTDSVTGKDPDTGEEVVVRPDPETGELTETVVPTEIRVETPPTFTGPYGDRAYIDFSGLTVAAYGEDGSKMQDVPFNELIFPVTVTDASAVVAGKGIRTLNGKSVEVATTVTIQQDCHPWSDRTQWILNRKVTNSCSAGVLIVRAIGGSGFIAISDTYDSSVHYQYSQDGEYRYSREERGKAGFNGTVSSLGNSKITGKPMYRGAVQGRDFTNDRDWRRTDTPDLAASRYGDNETADIALHGAGEIGGGQYVPVLWSRPGDGAVLETGFYIDVVDVSPSNNDGN